MTAAARRARALTSTRAGCACSSAWPGSIRTTLAATALAWLLARPAVLAPIASARSPELLAELLPVAELRLTGDEFAEFL